MTLTYYDRKLVAGTHYTIVIKKKNEETGIYETVTTINDSEGAYQVKIDGIPAKGFYGTKEYEFRFMSDDEKWINLINLIDTISSDSIVLTHNYYGGVGDSVLKIDKNLKINLNGKTIDRGLTTAVNRGQVIRISKGNTNWWNLMQIISLM